MGLQEVNVHIVPEKGSFPWTHDKLYCTKAQLMEGSCSTCATTDEPYSRGILLNIAINNFCLSIRLRIIGGTEL
jgi:hypothetical protein